MRLKRRWRIRPCLNRLRQVFWPYFKFRLGLKIWWPSNLWLFLFYCNSEHLPGKVGPLWECLDYRWFEQHAQRGTAWCTYRSVSIRQWHQGNNLKNLQEKRVPGSLARSKPGHYEQNKTSFCAEILRSDASKLPMAFQHLRIGQHAHPIQMGRKINHQLAWAEAEGLGSPHLHVQTERSTQFLRFLESETVPLSMSCNET